MFWEPTECFVVVPMLGLAFQRYPAFPLYLLSCLQTHQPPARHLISAAVKRPLAKNNGSSGKDALLSVLCLRSNKSHSSCSKDWVLYRPGCDIPFEVDIENGNNRHIRQLVAQLQKQVVYTAQGHHQYSIKTVAGVASDPIEPGNSRSW